MSILNGFKTFERYLKTPDGYQLYSERQLAKDVLMGDGKDSNNNIENNITQLSNPNLLINGDFQVWQRGESLETTKVNAFGYSADRWCYYASETKTIKKVDNGVYTEANLNQFLENKLKSGEPYVLSAMIDGEIHTLNIVGGVENENLRLRYAVGTSYDRIEILLRQGQESGEISSTTISWVKLEPGTIRTPFVPRLYEEEYLLCQRYFQYVYVIDSNLIILNNNELFYSKTFPYRMRTKPSYKLSSQVGIHVGHVMQQGFSAFVTYIDEIRLNVCLSKTTHGITVNSIPTIQGHVECDAEIYSA